MSVRLDIACILENDEAPPPVMFANWAGLERWSTRHELRCSPIEGARTTSAVRIVGDYQAIRGDVSFRYDQVWARAGYKRYARSLRTVALRGYNVDQAAMSGTHADHVINRGRLRQHPEAWVTIFPVHRSANCPFGSIEKMQPEIGKDTSRVDLPALTALKLFCGTLPRTRAELSHAMRDVRGQLDQNRPITKAFCDEMEALALVHMRSEKPMGVSDEL
ncbi:hypothetical protein ACQKLX_21245 [Bosea sp. NPDC003192]|uniref:hypothetical protein n=1 Tax=Bosea sp. NPDC003192 TaxID=3390551 RepID=UPI003D035E94